HDLALVDHDVLAIELHVVLDRALRVLQVLGTVLRLRDRDQRLLQERLLAVAAAEHHGVALPRHRLRLVTRDGMSADRGGLVVDLLRVLVGGRDHRLRVGLHLGKTVLAAGVDALSFDLDRLVLVDRLAGDRALLVAEERDDHLGLLRILGRGRRLGGRRGLRAVLRAAGQRESDEGSGDDGGGQRGATNERHGSPPLLGFGWGKAEGDYAGTGSGTSSSAARAPWSDEAGAAAAAAASAPRCARKTRPEPPRRASICTGSRPPHWPQPIRVAAGDTPPPSSRPRHAPP